MERLTKTGKPIARGILLGALCGAAFALLGIWGCPAVRQNGGAFHLILQIAWGHFIDEHIVAILIGLGAVVGAVTGGFLAVSKKGTLVLLAFMAGIVLGGWVVFAAGKKLTDELSVMTGYFTSDAEARTLLKSLKAFEGGTPVALTNYQHSSRQILSNYIHEVETLQKENHPWLNLSSPTYRAARHYLAPFAFADKKEEAFFWKTMIPRAQGYIERNGLAETDFGTNNIKHYRIDFYDNRPGGQAVLALNTGYSFDFFSDGQTTEVRHFSNGKVKTHYNLSGATGEQIRAVKSLNLQNKLNDNTAFELAEKYFTLQQHKEANFHPVEFQQLSWGNKNEPDYVPLPYYRAEWYRKDVNLAERKAGVIALPSVTIEISGIDSSLIHYSKSFMPVGSDF